MHNTYMYIHVYVDDIMCYTFEMYIPYIKLKTLANHVKARIKFHERMHAANTCLIIYFCGFI